MTTPQPDPARLRATALRSGRLDLEPLRVEHAAEMAEVLADPALHAFVGGQPAPEAVLRDRYRRMVAGSPDPRVSWCNWVLRHRASGRLTGYVQATVAPGDGGTVAEIAWVVGTGWQGRGLAREAARALVGRLRTLPVDAVLAHVHPDHGASAAVAAAAGLRPTGELHDGEVRWLLPLRGGGARD